MTTKTTLNTDKSYQILQPILEDTRSLSHEGVDTFLIKNATESASNSSGGKGKLFETSVVSEEGPPIILALVAMQSSSSSKISITFPSGVVYKGEWKNNMPDGQGKITLADDESYEGVWVSGQIDGYGIYITSSLKYSGDFFHGRFHGKGELIHASGSKYIGDFSEDNLHGKGKLIHADGENYIGDFFHGRFHGKGELIHTNGDKYVGDFSEGKFHGKGEYTYTRGDKYVGDFSEGKFHGKGELIDVNGNKYIGDFSDDKRHGKGESIYAVSNRYVGDFSDDKPHGKGELVRADGSSYVGDFFEGKCQGKGKLISAIGNTYIGDVSDGKPHGKGQSVDPDGNRYTGDFSEGKCQGKGESICVDGSRYVGDFSEDNPHGKGKLTHADGENYIGDFFKGIRHGKGELIYPNGKKYEGNFSEGKLHGTIIYTDQYGILHERIYDMNKHTYSKACTTAKTRDYKNKKKEEERKNKLTLTPNQFTEKSIDKPAVSIDASKKSQKKKISDAVPTENRGIPTVKEKILQLLIEGKHHLPKPHSRVSRWRCNNIIKQMENFQDDTEYRYRGMSPEKKQEMLLFHEAGSLLDPIIFHPDMKNLYTYQTDSGIGCHAEIISNGRTYHGVILFGINDNSICYHRMFEPRNNIDFFSLTMQQFFDVKPENRPPFLASDEIFYAEETENQLLYSNNLYELDEKTGIFSLHDTRENIQAIIRILPLTTTTHLARRSIDHNLFFMHYPPLHRVTSTTLF